MSKDYVTVSTHRRAFPKRKFADGGAFRTPEQQREDRIRQYGFDPMPSFSLGVDSAEAAAPQPMPSNVPSPMPMSPSEAVMSPRGSAARDVTSAAPGPTSTAQAPYAAPVSIPSASRANAENSPAAPKPIDWKEVAQGALKAQQGAGGSAGQSPIGGLAGLAGGALGKYLKQRAANKAAATDQSITDSMGRRTGADSNFSAAADGQTVNPNEPNLSRPAGMEGRGADLSGTDLSGVDLSSLAPDWEPDMAGGGFAKGGEVGPSQGGMNQRRTRPMRPSMPTPAPAGAPPSPPASSLGAPASAGSSIQGLPPGAGPTSNQAMMPNPAQMQALRSAQMGQMGGSPGGPPPGGPNPAFGPLPGGPPAGPPPGMGSMGPMAGPPPGGPGPSFGAPPGGPPPGGPPPGGPPMSPFMAAQAGGAPPPPGPGGAPSAQQLQQQMLGPGGMFGGPPPGGPPPGPPPGGPPPGGPPAQSLGAMPPGAASPQAAQQAAMQAALMRQQQQQLGGVPGMAKGGAVDADGYTPRDKTARDRQWGDVGKPAEDLPPEKKAKGGKIKVKHRAPFGKGAPPKKKVPPVPMVTDEDMDLNDGMPTQAAAAGPAGPPAGPPPGPPAGPPPAAAPPGMNKGGKCDDKMAKGGGVEEKGKTDCKTVKMAAGGVAKLRRGFPNTNKKPAKKFAKGGSVRGCGVATKGKNFAGIF